MKKYLNEGTNSEIIVTLISVNGIYATIVYPNGEIGEVLASRLTDVNAD